MTIPEIARIARACLSFACGNPEEPNDPQSMWGAWHAKDGVTAPDMPDEFFDAFYSLREESEHPAGSTYIVAVYLIDRAFGGREEGGWWYDTGELVRQVKQFRSMLPARRYAKRLNARIQSRAFGPNVGRPSISSVASRGEFYAEVRANSCERYYPENRPRYE